jgi:hypothetical protein
VGGGDIQSQRISWARGQTMSTFEFPTFRRPQFGSSIHKLPSASAAESDDDQMPAENLSDLLGRVSKNSTGEIDSLIGEFQRLRGTLQTDSERIQREIEEYAALSQQVMQLTKIISENVENVRASLDRPQGGASGKRNV